MRPKFVAANWKMNGSLSTNAVLLAALKSGLSAPVAVQCAVCVPAPYLSQAQAVLSGSSIAVGAQNVSQHPSGAYTGEVSVGMLKEFDCKFVIVGHSERRALYGEADQTVAEKVEAVLAAGLVPIFCVGESLAEREAGSTQAVVLRQVSAVLDRLGIDAFAKMIIAYEPVWAIGTGRTASPEQAQEVHAVIRHHLSVRDHAIASCVQILYGGSVKGTNAAEIFSMPDVDGGLIGGASLVAEDFLAICAAAR